MAKNKWLGALLLLATFILTLTTCDTGSGRYFTVSFNADGGEPAPASQKVLRGSLIAEPEEMAKEGHDFGSWHKDADCTLLWDFAHDVVTEDITLYAKWAPSESKPTGGGGGGGGGGGTTPTNSLGISPSTIAYGSLTYSPALSPAATTVTITNKTAAPVDITGIALGGTNPGSFTLGGITPPPPDINVAPGASISFTVQPNTGLAAGVYSATITVANDAGAALTASVSITVNKANPAVTWPSGLSATVGQTLSNISLPGDGTGTPAGTFTWTAAGTTPVGAAGTKTFSMTFTPSDTVNYNTLTQMVTVTVLSFSIDMVWVDGGKFWLGYDSGAPYGYGGEREVTMSGYWIGRYPVTQKVWETVMQKTIELDSTFASRSFSVGRGDNYPMYNVSWYDAIVFCNRLSDRDGLSRAYYIPFYGSSDPDDWGAPPTSNDANWNAVQIVTGSTGYRLPSEAQWEYAAKGRDNTQSSFIWSGSNNSNEVAWTVENSGGAVHFVGVGKNPNGLGLYDMSGNVWEWCWDWFSGAYDTSTNDDPSGAASGSRRVARGGSWNYIAAYARCAIRNDGNPDGWSYGLGFRVSLP